MRADFLAASFLLCETTSSRNQKRIRKIFRDQKTGKVISKLEISRVGQTEAKLSGSSSFAPKFTSSQMLIKILD